MLEFFSLLSFSLFLSFSVLCTNLSIAWEYKKKGGLGRGARGEKIIEGK
jgi:hypothetical protein